jgi:hypothetical protein
VNVLRRVRDKESEPEDKVIVSGDLQSEQEGHGGKTHDDVNNKNPSRQDREPSGHMDIGEVSRGPSRAIGGAMAMGKAIVEVVYKTEHSRTVGD